MVELPLRGPQHVPQSLHSRGRTTPEGPRYHPTSSTITHNTNTLRPPLGLLVLGGVIPGVRPNGPMYFASPFKVHVPCKGMYDARGFGEGIWRHLEAFGSFWELLGSFWVWSGTFMVEWCSQRGSIAMHGNHSGTFLSWDTVHKSCRNPWRDAARTREHPLASH